jgi:hypothetical protein
MHYIEIEHPTEAFDIIVTCDEDYRVVECKESLLKTDIELSNKEKVLVQAEVDQYFEL